MAILVTQTGVETWVNSASKIRVSQIGVETWVHGPGSIRVSQIGSELWITNVYLPQFTTGHADGFATAGLFTSDAFLVRGQADGHATAGLVDLPPGTPLIMDMGI